MDKDLTGFWISSYCLEKKIGEGSHGTVYKATRNDTKDTPYAVKIITSDESDEDQLKHLNNEAYILQALKDDDNFVQIVSYSSRKYPACKGDDNETLYYWIATEYLDGNTLTKEIKNFDDIYSFVNIITSLCGIVEKLHTNKKELIIHGDLKSDNIILLRENGKYKIKIIDFSSATIGTNISTISKSKIDDIHRLGVIAYDLWQGEISKEEDFPKTPEKDFKGKLKHFHKNKLHNVIKKSINANSKNKDHKKYQNISEFKKELEDFYNEIANNSGSISSPNLPSPQKEPPPITLPEPKKPESPQPPDPEEPPTVSTGENQPSPKPPLSRRKIHPLWFLAPLAIGLIAAAFIFIPGKACGNGTKDPGEDCDRGDTKDGDGCDSKCYFEICGNGHEQTGETCDDGNKNNDDSCPDGINGTCKNAECGDGFTNRTGGEECDEGKMKEGNDKCETTCKLPRCGDGLVNKFYLQDLDNDKEKDDLEQCEPFNPETKNGDVNCQNNCQYKCETVEDCHKKGKNPCLIYKCNNKHQCEIKPKKIDQDSNLCDEEVCKPEDGSIIHVPTKERDDSNICTNDDLCNPETGEITHAPLTYNKDNENTKYTCTVPEGSIPINGSNYICVKGSCQAAVCGDEVIFGEEECDDGNKNKYDNCLNCKNAFCGDGVIFNENGGTEQCDDGKDKNSNEPNACRPDCTKPSCGDGIVDNGIEYGEVCDVGKQTPNDGCASDCKKVDDGYECTGSAPSQCTPTCGDGKKVGNEACDDGNQTPNDGCASDCKKVDDGYECTGDNPNKCEKPCGNGAIDNGEECDGANLNGKTCSDNPDPNNKNGALACSEQCKWDFKGSCTP